MQTGTSYFDVAQVALYAFWLFFAGLIYYLRTEDKREGYPLESDRSPNVRVEGFPPMPKPKTFILPHGGVQTAPRREAPEVVVNAEPIGPWPGAPLQPIGDPMLSGVGPGAYARRSDRPDTVWGSDELRTIPLRSNAEFSLAAEDPDPRGMTVIGGDGQPAGTVVDAWIDRLDMMVRFLEVEIVVAGVARQVLLPMNLAKIDGGGGRVLVDSILAHQFAGVPPLASPDRISSREEDRIGAYYAGGSLYAEPSRLGPLL